MNKGVIKVKRSGTVIEVKRSGYPYGLPRITPDEFEEQLGLVPMKELLAAREKPVPVSGRYPTPREFLEATVRNSPEPRLQDLALLAGTVEPPGRVVNPMTPAEFGELMRILLPDPPPRVGLRRRSQAKEAARQARVREQLLGQQSLPSFATGGAMDFGFTEQEIAAFGGTPVAPLPPVPVADVPAIPATSTASASAALPVEPAPSAAPPSVADVPVIPATTAPPPPAPTPTVPDVPAIPTTTAPPPAAATPSAAPPLVTAAPTPTVPNVPAIPATAPQPSAAAPQPVPLAEDDSTAATPGSEFTPAQVQQFGDDTQISPDAAAALAAGLQPGSEFSTAEVQQFGNDGLAALTDAEIIEAFSEAEDERLAFECDFGPIVEQEQLEAAQRQFNQDFGPLVEQEIADTRDRQRAQFEQELLETQARQRERERLARRQEQLEQFEREFMRVDPNHPTSFAPQDPRLERFREEFFHPESLETDPNLPSSFAPLIPGTVDEQVNQAMDAYRRLGLDNIIDRVVVALEGNVLERTQYQDDTFGPGEYDPKRRTLSLNWTPFLEPAHEDRGDLIGSASSTGGVAGHEIGHVIEQLLDDEGLLGDLDALKREVELLIEEDRLSSDPRARGVAEQHRRRADDKSGAGQKTHVFTYLLGRPDGVLTDLLAMLLEMNDKIG